MSHYFEMLYLFNHLQVFVFVLLCLGLVSWSWNLICMSYFYKMALLTLPMFTVFLLAF